MEGETGTHQNKLSKSGKREGGREGGMVEYMLPCKTTLSVNAKAVKAVNMSPYMESWCMHISKMPLSTTGEHMRYVNCIVHLQQETS